MNQYYRITNQGNINKINYYNPLCGCFQDMCSCTMGFFFPFCLFGRIYEKAGFGLPCKVIRRARNNPNGHLP